MKKYVITTFSNYIIAVLFEEDKPVLIHGYDKEEEVLLGNVYVGRVQNIVKNINSAFVEIGKDKVCYYSLEDNQRHIILNRADSGKVRQGDLMLVQVSKEAIKSKAPSLSSNISFTGSFVVLALDGKGQVAVSAKIMDEEYKKDIHNTLVPLVQKGEGRFSLVVRTAAFGADKSAVVREAASLVKIAEDICRKAPYRPAFTCLYQKEPPYVSDLREGRLSSGDRIITDNEFIYDAILKADFGLSTKPEFYVDKFLPLYKLYNVEKYIREALNRKVWLKSGAYLVIEPTEALTVIDVNTGKFDGGKKDREDTFLKINLEAAAEICRQLRIRNISGIIIVDFINLEKEENRAELLRHIKRIIEDDPVPAFFVEMTKLGLVELTRKKIKKPLHEILENFTHN